MEISNILIKLLHSQDLAREEAVKMMRALMSGELSAVKTTAFLTGLAIKGETQEEIAGLAKVMRDFAVKVKAPVNAVDTCGTGGSGLKRINTSTMVAFVLAAGRVAVAKHGNRAASGRCGSFDVLEALGAKIELSATQVERSLRELGLGFMLAPIFHPAMKYVMPVRKELGFRTVFNILGPLTNPARVKRQILGVSDPVIGRKMARTLQQLGHRRAMVVAGSDGLDELSITGKNQVFELKNGEIKDYELDPREYGFKKVPFKALEGGNAQENAWIFRSVLRGRKSSKQGEIDAKRDLVILNSAAGFLIADKVKSLKAGIDLARTVINSGQAFQKLQDYIKTTKRILLTTAK